MANCPNCQVSLRTVRQREGIIYVCDQCGGKAVTVPQIRRFTGDRYAGTLTVFVNKSTSFSERGCPFCGARAKWVEMPQLSVMVEACKPCMGIWLENGVFEQLPEGASASMQELQLRGAEAEGQWRLEELKRQQEREDGGDDPQEVWKWIPALVGLPVKARDDEPPYQRWATWVLSALVILISVVGFTDIDVAADNFGMVPAEWWRYGGFTLISSFFIHGGVWHLVGNLYFFLLFGGSVERFLGHWRFLGLVFAATIFGDAFHIAMEPQSIEPCIGASGGISGVLVFYACQFPKAKLAWFSIRLLRWIRIPAWVAFILWLALQSLGVFLQMAKLSNVSALAHLGGVTAGFFLWFWWRKSGKVEAVEVATTGF